MKNLLLVFFLAPIILLQAQPFEGKISYENSYKSKMPNVTDLQLGGMMGTKQEYYIKGENFKSVANGTFFQWQIYLAKDNKLYNKFSNSESVYWMDVSKNDDELVSANLRKNAVEILGYSCDELELTYKSGVHKYYFNSAIGVDPTPYKNFKFLNWYEFLSRSKALPLKISMETSQYILTSIATKIDRQTLDASQFTLPAGVAIEKSPY